MAIYSANGNISSLIGQTPLMILIEQSGTNSGNMNDMAMFLIDNGADVTFAQDGVKISGKVVDGEELLAALSVKNKSQAAKIVKYFGSNPRSFAMPVTLSMMFSFFADLMQAYYSPDKTDKGVAQWLGKPDWKVRNEIMPAMRCYTGRQVMEILSLIRQADAASKGVGGCKTPPGELLLELVYRILG